MHKQILTVTLALLISAALYGLSFISPATAIPYGAGGYGNCAYGGACSISLTTSGALAIALAPTADGVYSIQKDPVTITTKNPLGYSLALESNSATSAALSSGASSLVASGGTPDDPLSLGINSWGYRLDGQAGFGLGPTSATTNAESNALSFAGLSLKGSPQTIYSQGTASATSGDTINVWYGIRANSTMPSGSYQQTVIYTAIAVP